MKSAFANEGGSLIAKSIQPYRQKYFLVIIQHPLELLMIPSDKLAYLTDLSGSRGRTSGETALSAHSEEHKVF